MLKVGILGVGGISMHQLALAFKSMGLIVYGYDAQNNKYTKLCEEKGIKVGLLAVKTVWPFPEKALEKLSEFTFLTPYNGSINDGSRAFRINLELVYYLVNAL